MIVLESPDRIQLESIVFDTRQIDGDGRGANHVTVGISDESRSAGFTTVAAIALEPRTEKAFSLSGASPGRWIRLEVLDNHGASDYVEIMGVRGYGSRLTNVLAAPSLTSFSAGATVAKRPSEYASHWSALLMLDENPATGWASKSGETENQTTVIALPERTELSHLVFDTGAIDGGGRGANHVVVEMSDSSDHDAFQEIARIALDDRRNNQVFSVSRSIPGRWLRVTALDNHGAADYCELMELRGIGRQLTSTPFGKIDGTYRTDYGAMHLRQEGTSVTGCYEHAEGLITGGTEGRVLKLTWRQSNGSGPAIMVFSPDGGQLTGLWWYAGQEGGHPGFWNGSKSSSETGSCAHWAGGVEAQIASDLEELGRAIVYGINFDIDSDVLRDESKPTLDKIVAILRDHSKWKLMIEGHTDSTGGAEHNQTLSEKRASSVARYLEAAGIDGSRLSTSGFGATRPIAPNGSPLGRAQNRRVELKKQ